MKKTLLSIAGFDPTSGAGLVLDIKVFEELGFNGVGILTSLTVQNTERVKRIQFIPPDFLWEEYQALKEDMSIAGIKTGMVGSPENAEVLGRIMKEEREIPVVVDPVFRSSSGAWLLEKNAIPFYLKKIKGKASLFTPNREEASLITGTKIGSKETMMEAVREVYSLTEIPSVIKGVSLNDKVVDVLFDGKEFHFCENRKIHKKVHGTGCFYSSSFLCFLARNESLKDAFRHSNLLTCNAREKAVSLGRGQNIITFPLKP